MKPEIDKLGAFDGVEEAVLSGQEQERKLKKLLRSRNILMVVFFITSFIWILINPEKSAGPEENTVEYKIGYHFGSVIGLVLIIGVFRLMSLLPALIPLPKKNNFKPIAS